MSRGVQSWGTIMSSPDIQADEIIEMACRIERNGTRFYTDAAETVTDPEVKQLLLDLARMEKQHEAIFTAIGREWKDGEKDAPVHDPDGETLKYCRAMADMHVFNNWTVGTEGVGTILLKALDAEKDTIAFFTGMKYFVPEKIGRRRINEVIREEMTHIRLLSRKIRELD